MGRLRYTESQTLPLEAADEERVGRQELTGRACFHMPFSKAGIELLKERRLFGNRPV